MTHLFLKFKALAVVPPGACAELGEVLSTAELGSLRMHVLADALAAAGNPAAQAALCAAVQGRAEDEPSMAILIPAISTAESPTPQAQQTLEMLAFHPQQTNRQQGPTRVGHAARNLADDLRRKPQYRRATAPGAGQPRGGRLAMATAVGHRQFRLARGFAHADAISGQPRATSRRRGLGPALDRFSKRRPPADRRSSSRRKGARVRLEAVRALQFRQKTAGNFGAQKQALSTEAEPDIRAALLGNLSSFRDSLPEARQLVESAAAHDPSLSVREAAAKLLQPARAAP